ncbi:MAG: threonine--tRNA ligase [Cryomorphaceae bacterium]|nr:threonine--tRNA ligase [Cryomorphaceae bacterium]
MITISFPDGNQREFAPGIQALDVAKSISHGLAKNVLSASLNGKTIEATTPITENGTIEFYTWDHEKGKTAFWHSSAHLMAQAILHFFPNAKLTIGPPVEDGFYYDIDFGEETISEKQFPEIEKKMLEFAREKAVFSLRPVSKMDALTYYKDNPFKTELISDLEDGSITFCDHSNFTDLCRGGHIPHTGLIKAVKILRVAGAYWRGDEKNKQLTRVYGISFPKQAMLDEYLNMLEEAKKRDHRKLGQELELFTFSQRVGKGLPLWMPKGAALRERLENFLKAAQKKMGYEQVISPHIGNKDLYICSGHYEKYGADSFQPINTPEDGEQFLLKPMNCPHHCEMFKAFPHSYKDLPVRYAEFGTVYRYEQSGELHGLTRVRGFTQDDAHIFCTPDQLKDEFKKVIDLVMYIFNAMKFTDYVAQISLRDPDSPQKYIGSDENWEKAERAIIEAAEEKGLNTVTETGEAAFYGPKLDFMVRDAIGRKWQLGTIQVDYNLPERFELEYKGSDNQMHRPVMIHRAPFGSMERFVAILLEHCAGKLPLWLAPDQVMIIPISEKFADYANKLSHVLKNYDIRALVDHRAEKAGRKIRDAEVGKYPYMLVVGEKEVNSNTVAVRKQGHGDLGTQTVEAFAQHIQSEIDALISDTNGLI